jgi:hypothetical protein
MIPSQNALSVPTLQRDAEKSREFLFEKSWSKFKVAPNVMKSYGVEDFKL